MEHPSRIREERVSLLSTSVLCGGDGGMGCRRDESTVAVMAAPVTRTVSGVLGAARTTPTGSGRIVQFHHLHGQTGD